MICENLPGLKWLLLMAGSSAFAQVPVDADRIPLSAWKFDHAPGSPAMKCEFRPVQPKLNYGLRYDAGYILRFPMGQFQGPDHTIEVLLRVTPRSEASSPVFLSRQFKLPPLRDTNLDWEVSGRFAIDTGPRRIESLATDDTGRVCRSQWSVDVRRGPTRSRRPSTRAAGKLTVFLNATPLNGKTNRLPPPDIEMLTEALAGLYRNLPSASVRLIVFNLDAEAEFLRSQSFVQADAGRLAQVLSSVQPGVIDYRRLQSRVGRSAFLAGLIQREIEEADRSQTVIFLGPLSLSPDQVAKGIIAGSSHPTPAFYYLQYRAHRQTTERNPSNSPGYSTRGVVPLGPSQRAERLSLPDPPPISSDTIEQIMRQLDGRTLAFSAPEEFAHALDRIAAARGR